MKKKVNKKDSWGKFHNPSSLVEFIKSSSTVGLIMSSYYNDKGDLHPKLLKYLGAESGSEEEKAFYDVIKQLHEDTIQVMITGFQIIPPAFN